MCERNEVFVLENTYSLICFNMRLISDEMRYDKVFVGLRLGGGHESSRSAMTRDVPSGVKGTRRVGTTSEAVSE